MPDTTSANLSPRDVLARYHRAMLDKSADDLAEYAADAVHEFPFLFPGMPERYQGREEVRAGYRAAWGASPAQPQKIHDVLVHEGIDRSDNRRARQNSRLVGFVNVAWDGGVHAFILDTMVATDLRGACVGTELVTTAARGARAAKCEWLHVDFEDHLRAFYFDACGFKPTDAGLIAL